MEEIGIFEKEVKRICGLIASSLFGWNNVLSSGLAPSKGLILEGSPGSGKSLLAHSIAKHSGLDYHIVSCPEIFQKNQGESESLLRQVFRKASSCSPSLIIMDEVDIIASEFTKESQIEARVFQLLLSLLDELMTVVKEETETKQLANRVFVLALTNRPHVLSPALIRSGRLDISVRLDMKTHLERTKFLQRITKSLPLSSEGGKPSLNLLEEVSSLSPGFSPADLLNLCREALLISISRTKGSPSLLSALFLFLSVQQTRNAFLFDKSSVLLTSG